jgi:hypothetical protein
VSRRSFLSQLAAFPLAALAGFDSASGAQAPASPGRGKPLNIMMKSAWGSDDPTKAAFPFLHGLAQTLEKVSARKIQIFACGACSRARGVSEADLANYGAKYGNPTIFVGLVEWADRVITE